jgi:predicted TIM-barrel fold metal-dependent hydrolase
VVPLFDSLTHPTLSGRWLGGDLDARFASLVDELDHHAPLDQYPRTDPFMTTVELLRQAPGTRVVLVHGGDVQLLRYSQLVRHNPRLLLDLSHTMLAYEGSSLDADLRFLFERRDQRICVGSDHPEFRPDDLRRRFDELANGISYAALENIGHANLQRFLGRD